MSFYRICMAASPYLMRLVLASRLKSDKEDPARVTEKRGRPSCTRPKGPLFWLHAASVGEAQSALILIKRLLDDNPALHMLVTTGTRTSAEIMAKALPERTLHQYYPLDVPQWCSAFLDYWQPDSVLWMESELWPVMLDEIKRRKIPAALINARMSPRSLKRWKLLQSMAHDVLRSFSLILTQTERDAEAYKSLGAQNVFTTGNLKYSAAPLPCDDNDLKALRKACNARALWLYASTHAGEEELAARVHSSLKADIPDLLTIIVPRHPERGINIARTLKETDSALTIMQRGMEKTLPPTETDIYIADTLGELGLFYRLSPIAVIGRSFSDDGGGGHNPLEAALLDCVVMHGPHVQNLQDIYDDMALHGASLLLRHETDFTHSLKDYLQGAGKQSEKAGKAKSYAESKTAVLDTIMETLHAHNWLESLKQEGPHAA